MSGKHKGEKYKKQVKTYKDQRRIRDVEEQKILYV